MIARLIAWLTAPAHEQVMPDLWPDHTARKDAETRRAIQFDLGT